MRIAVKRTRKHFQLDPAKIKRAQRALHAKTVTEAIERALDFALEERKKTACSITPRRSLKRGIEITGVYGTLVG